MSLAGFKKQVNKVNQYMSERIGGAKGTELDYEFTEMERKMDVMGRVVEEMIARTHELLQPNPGSRAKLSAVNSISKMRGQAKHALYPQPEGQLGECMTKYGKELGEESCFGGSLVETGDAYKQMADIKYSLEDNVKQNFIEPLHHLQNKELKEINYHRKKLSGRRLDFDCKKRKQTKDKEEAAAGSWLPNIMQGGSHVTEEEIRMAEEKFDETKELTETAMFNLLENDVEQMSQLSSFIEAELNYHRQCSDVLQSLFESLTQRTSEAASRPKSEYVPKVNTSRKFDSSPNYDNNYDMADQSGYSLSPAKPGYGGRSPDDDDYSDESKDADTVATGAVAIGTVAKSADTKPDRPSRPVTIMEPKAVAKESSETDASAAVATETADEDDKKPGGSQPCCEALYDFDPENEGELAFREGDIIQLVSRIDENWYEGSVNGVAGFFPVNYVKVIVDVQ